MPRRASVLFILSLTILLFFPLLASAQTGNDFTVYLSDEIELTSAGKIAKASAQRDLVTPLINDEAGFLYKQTKAENTYLFSFLPERDQALFLSLPGLKNVSAATVDGCAVTPSKGVSVALGKPFEVVVSASGKSTAFSVIITSLPIVSLSLELSDIVDDDSETVGDFVLVDPDYVSRGFAPYRFESKMNVGYRGNTARYYTDKRNFGVKLIKDDGSDYDYSLLGMRCDNSWILDGMYNDILRMRNRVCFELWDEMYEAPYNNKVTGAIDGTFVEVFVNGIYKGVFCMSEKMDRKLLKLDKQNGILYRSTLSYKSGGAISDFSFTRFTPPTAADEWYNMEIKYPKEDISEETWKLFYELVQLTIKGKNTEFEEKVGDLVNLDNLVDYYIYINVIAATDNMNKNMFWACENTEKDTRLILFPWDMDASLGRRYNAIKTVVSQRYSNKLFDRLVELNVDHFTDRVKARYAELRDTTLSIPNIMSIIQKNYDYVNRANAWEREMSTHPTFTDHQAKGTYKVNPFNEIAVVRKFLDKHLEWLDKKYGYVIR